MSKAADPCGERPYEPFSYRSAQEEHPSLGLKCRVGKEKGRSDTDIPHVGIQAAGFRLFKTVLLQNIRITLSNLVNSIQNMCIFSVEGCCQ